MGSAAETKDGTAGSGGAGESLGKLGSTRTNALAAEIPVNATGTRPGSGPDKRELFSEETETVLVFPDGAVIRLSAAVATGQLIFLRNKRTNIEVVSQVVGKRVYRPTSCYLELKFTEDIAEFWGVEFPKQAAEPVKVWTAAVVNEAAHQEAVAEAVQSAEPVEESAVAETVQPTGKEVEELREQIEALRKQLEEMKRAEAAAKSVANMAEPGHESQSQVVPMQMLVAPPSQVAPSSPVGTTSQMVPEAAPTAVPELAARSSHVGMKLPSLPPVKIDPEQEVIDQLLPQPGLDFSKAPKLERDPNDPYSIYKPTRAKVGKWVLVLLVFGLIGAVGLGAWKLGLVNRLLAGGKKTGGAPTQAQTKQQTIPAKGPEISQDGAKPGAGANSGGSAAVVPKDTGEAAKAEPENAVDEKAKAVEEVPAAVPAKKAVVEKKSVSRADSVKRGTTATKKTAGIETKAAAAPVEAAPVDTEGPVVAAKLLRSVSPEYPPDAMRNFITGDVKLKAEVDEKGKLRNVQVVSGPAALREAAIAAFKQYEYAAATRGGKSVASEVKVTIKFWFDP